MDKRDIKDGALDRAAHKQIVLSQYKILDDPEYDSGWECDVFVNDWYIGGGTSPTQAGAYDLANEIIYDHENPSEY
jgi:hypothetical protein